MRSLKNFPGSEPAMAAAQALAANEKDVAVRDRAKETYVALTGKEPAVAPPARRRRRAMLLRPWGIASRGSEMV